MEKWIIIALLGVILVAMFPKIMGGWDLVKNRLPNPYSLGLFIIMLTLGFVAIVCIYTGVHNRNVWTVVIGFACGILTGFMNLGWRTPDTTGAKKVLLVEFFGERKPYVVEGLGLFLDWLPIQVVDAIEVTLEKKSFEIKIEKIRCRDGGVLAGRIELTLSANPSPLGLMAWLDSKGADGVKEILDAVLISGTTAIINKDRTENDEVIEDPKKIAKMRDKGTFPLTYWEWVTRNSKKISEELDEHIRACTRKNGSVDENLLESTGAVIEKLRVILPDTVDGKLADARTKRLIEFQEGDSEVADLTTIRKAAELSHKAHHRIAHPDGNIPADAKPTLDDCERLIMEQIRIRQGRSFSINNPKGLTLAEINLQELAKGAPVV